MKTVDLVEIEQVGGILVLTPASVLRECYSDELLQGDPAGALARIESGQVRSVIVDCRGVNLFCSAGFAYLIRLWKKTQSRGGRVVLCNVAPTLQEAIDVLHLGKLWQIVGSVDDATRSLRRDGG